MKNKTFTHIRSLLTEAQDPKRLYATNAREAHDWTKNAGDDSHAVIGKPDETDDVSGAWATHSLARDAHIKAAKTAPTTRQYKYHQLMAKAHAEMMAHHNRDNHPDEEYKEEPDDD